MVAILPAAAFLLRARQIADVSAIKGTGLGGRILKGDVLAFLGLIDKDSPSALAGLIHQREHLDLSHIDRAPLKKKEEAAQMVVEQPVVKENAQVSTPTVTLPAPPRVLTVSRTIDISPLLKFQRKWEQTFNSPPPSVDSLMERALNQSLATVPAFGVVKQQPNADSIFNELVGAKSQLSVPKRDLHSTTLSIEPAAGMASVPPNLPSPAKDIIDILAGTSRSLPHKHLTIPYDEAGSIVRATIVTELVDQEQEAYECLDALERSISSPSSLCFSN